MNGTLNPHTERTLQFAIDLGERIFVLLLFAALVVRLSHTLEMKPYNLLVLISEGAVAIFIVLRRNAIAVTTRSFDWAVALLGTTMPMFVRPGGQPLLPPVAGTALMLAGLTFAIWAKATLRLSFGIAAANRGAVMSGPYRFLRHPMYAGYIAIYVGFLLNNPLLWNIAIYITAIGLLAVRILAEENILRTDPLYVAYMQPVRYRLLPGLF